MLVETAEATSVRRVSVDEMMNNCEFVFEGRVISLESRMTANSSNIHTYVVFKIVDTIKGSYNSAEITLSFAGGTVNGLTRHVSDMHMPVVGETGIYFVESLARTQVNPFYGWSQGHLLLLKDAAGNERVTTVQQQPVMAVEPVVRRSQPQLSSGVAEGLVLEQRGNNYKGMSKADFVRKLRGMMKQP